MRLNYKVLLAIILCTIMLWGVSAFVCSPNEVLGVIVLFPEIID